MVARTTISDGYRARAHALVALARSWRPTEVLPGARTWVEAQAAGQDALSGLQGHLAIEPPPDQTATAPGRPRRRSRSPRGRRRPGIGCASPWLQPPATATRTPPPPWSAKPRPTAWTWPSCWRWPRPTGPSPACTVAPGGPDDAGPQPECGGASASRPSGTGRTGAPAMTEPRLRAIVSALVGAIAALAFLVSFRAISEFAVQTGAFPYSPGVGGAAAGRQLHPGRLHRGPALSPGRPAGRLPLVPGRRLHPRLGRPERRPRPRPSGRPGGRRHPPGGAAAGPGAADARRPPLPGRPGGGHSR